MTELEICIDSVESAIAADRGGAHRVELCSALELGGLTPSAGLMQIVRRAISIDLFVMIRPRAGDFAYSDRELEVMAQDIFVAKQIGADGVVLGILNRQGGIDIPAVRRLVESARPLQVTFHRAFDCAADLTLALEDIIATGANRILTSGGQPTAIRGTDRLRELQRQAGSRIRLMAGSGIRPGNVRELLQRTGIAAVHTSLSSSLAEAQDKSDSVPLAIGSPQQTVTEMGVREMCKAIAGLAAADLFSTAQP